MEIKTDKRADRPSISFIGAGNVAWHLANRFHESSYPILQICDRNPSKASELASQVDAVACNRISQLSADCQVLVVCVQDDHIKKVGHALADHGMNNLLVVHTSGVHGAEIFPEDLNRRGVLYPLNTFTKGIDMELGKTPLFIECNSDGDLAFLRELASAISGRIYLRKPEKMPMLHLGAVFVNNFTNQLFKTAEELMLENSIPFELLLPLMEQSVRKLESLSAKEAQTGPASRGDMETIQTHLELLSENPEAREIYRRFSELINPECKLDH